MLYSGIDVPLVLIPVIAWAGQIHHTTDTRSPTVAGGYVG